MYISLTSIKILSIKIKQTTFDVLRNNEYGHNTTLGLLRETQRSQLLQKQTFECNYHAIFFYHDTHYGSV